MALSTKELIYLGNYADADTDEASFFVEDGSVFTQTFGSSGSPLFNQKLDVTFDDANNNNVLETNNTSTETISYDLGGGPIVAELDSLQVVELTVTYMDGSTADLVDVVMLQDSTGNLFLANSNFAGTDLNSTTLIKSINVTSIDGTTGFSGAWHNAFQDFVCFAAGTHIATPSGLRLVEDLRPGTLVMTQDHGAQPVLWAGSSRVTPSSRTRPVCIPAGSLGPGQPNLDLYVSRQHRVLMRSKIVDRMFRKSEVFCPARMLIGFGSIEQAPWPAHRPLAYHHLLFARHEVIFANGALVESLLPGAEALRSIGEHARAQVLSALPGLERANPIIPARPIPRPPRLKTLLARKSANDVPLFCATTLA